MFLAAETCHASYKQAIHTGANIFVWLPVFRNCVAGVGKKVYIQEKPRTTFCLVNTISVK